jgi:subtilase family serine protease
MEILPDLLVTTVTAQSKVYPGATITVSDTTTNRGAASGESVTAVYLSSDATLDPADLPLGSRAVDALDAGLASSGQTTVTVPADLAAGTYYLIAAADAGAAIREVSETNNTRAKTITTGPDLVVSQLAPPASAAIGETIVVTDTTRNLGSAAGSTATRFYLSLDTVVDAGDVLLGARAVPALGLNEASTGEVALTIPGDTVPGTYYVVAQADGEGAIGELVEANNLRARTLAIAP